MLHRKFPDKPRIPHHLAVLAALALLITAWTERPADPATAEHASRADGSQASRTTEAREPDSGGLASDSRTRARFSLMLFRFN